MHTLRRLAIALSLSAPTIATGCIQGEIGSLDEYGSISHQEASGNRGDKVVLPLEVLGKEGFKVKVNVYVDDATGVNKLYVQGHRLAYGDSSVNSKRAPKGSVRINGGLWIDLSNDNADVYEPEASLGGITGAYYTVRFTLPIGGIKNGKNKIEFKLNNTDGTSLGYRILDFNLLKGKKAVLPASDFIDDNPAEWKPPLPAASDIAAGKALWETATLTESPLSSHQLKAACADCHAHDGRGLKYFNYSNRSIRARAEFHGLTKKEGRQIASYIRSLNMPAPNQARPWNPPYQPGPGMDSRPVTDWSAGAGLQWVLDDDKQMLPYLFPNGTSKQSIASALNADGVLNLRDIPIALQLPDWNAWLPLVHGKDLWGNSFMNGGAQAAYEQSRAELQSQGKASLVASGKLGETFERMSRETGAFIAAGQTVGKGEKWRVMKGAQLDARDKRYDRELTKLSLAQWSAVKQWEMMQEFDLEDTAPELYGQELRAWPGGGQSAFPVAPHMTADDQVKFDWQTKTVGKYQSTAWYQVQMTLNAGQRQAVSSKPMDWKYQFRHITQFHSASGVAHPLRLVASVAKGYQNMNNGVGPTKQGWKMQEVHPLWHFSETSKLDSSMIDKLAGYEPGLRGKLLGALIDEFVAVSSAIPQSDWIRCAHGSGLDTAYCIEPASHVPTLPKKKFFAVPEDYHADNFFRLMPLLSAKGVSSSTLQGLADWCEAMWPKANWHALI